MLCCEKSLVEQCCVVKSDAGVEKKWLCCVVKSGCVVLDLFFV